MSARKLFNARHELYGLMLMCDSPETAGKTMMALPNIDYFATSWAREAYKRLKERYESMEISDGALNFTSLVSDSLLSESTRERLETGRQRFKDERIDSEEVINSLTKFRQLRRINELSEHINNALQEEGDVDPIQILDDISEHVADTRSGSLSTENWFFHLGTQFNLSPVLDRIYSNTERNFVPTGIAAFDEKNGGITYGSTMMLVGTTGGGKTLVAQNLAQNMSMYEDVCLVTLEMSEDEQVARMLAREGEVDLSRIMSKNWTDEEKDRALSGLKAFHKKVKKQGNRLTIVRPDRDVSAQDIITLLHPYNYRVIIVDYLGLLEGADGDDQPKALSRIGRAFKVYASAHKKVVIQLAQGNEEGKTRYSRALMEHANNMWTFIATEHTKEQGIIDVEQPKARNQDPSPFTLEVEYKFMRVSGDSSRSVKDEEASEGEGRSDKPTGGKASSSKGKDTKKAKPTGGGKKYLDTVRDL